MSFAKKSFKKFFHGRYANVNFVPSYPALVLERWDDDP